jgi:hypothetical protein
MPLYAQQIATPQATHPRPFEFPIVAKLENIFFDVVVIRS